MTDIPVGLPGPSESRLANRQRRPQRPPRLDMAIIMGITPQRESTADLAVATHPPFFPCCVCSAALDMAQPVHVCHRCRKTHCAGCGAWMDDGSRRCVNCLAGAGCQLSTLATAASTLADNTKIVSAAGVRPYGRGNIDQLTQIALDPTAVRAARIEFNGAIYSGTSRVSNESRTRTWARACGCLQVCPQTLSPEGIHTVMSVLRQAGYRSAKLILSQAKTNFIRRGGQWTAQLDQAAREANRAADRDLGPPQQSCPYPVDLLHSLPGGSDPRVSGGPAFPKRTDVVSCYFALRGAEIIAARAQNVGRSSKGTSMTLSKTKTDPAALGTTRTHACACPVSRGKDALIKLEVCPACCTWDQAQWALATFGNHPQTPLFPTLQGGQLAKHNLVKHLEAAFEFFHLPVKGHGGGRSVGEHSCRNGIARFLASRGVPVWQIQGLLRHSASGQTVLRYIKEAHVHASTNLAEEAEMGQDLQAMRRKMAAFTSESKEVESNIRATLAKALQDSAAFQRPHVFVEREDLLDAEHGKSEALALEDADPAEPPAVSSSPSLEGKEPDEIIYVVSTQPGGRGVTHILDSHQPDRTRCGWRFLRTKWHALTNNPLCDPPSKGIVDPPPGGCRPICKLCLG
jgi:hypothetical protein